MNFILWNVNGLRAILKKDSLSFLNKYDFIILNETKVCKSAMEKIDESKFLDGYYRYHSISQVKKGYSGVSIYTKIKPEKQINVEEPEGRVVVLEYKKFILVGVYVPNAGHGLKRLEWKTKEWFPWFFKLISSFKKPLIIAGDINVAPTDKDVFSTIGKSRQAGITIEERTIFMNLLENIQLRDAWRRLNPKKIEYTYFDYRTKARSRNSGWRIDLFLTSEVIPIKNSKILNNIMGSDHIPVTLTVEKSFF